MYVLDTVEFVFQFTFVDSAFGVLTGDDLGGFLAFFGTGFAATIVTAALLTAFVEEGMSHTQRACGAPKATPTMLTRTQAVKMAIHLIAFAE